MPPRYSYWTIIAGGLPTAFRAAERDDLMPTFKRLQEKHPDAEMKWFARGKLWESPEAAREDTEARRRPPEGHRAPLANRPPAPAGERRGRDWRPGGEHRDPRQKFKDAKKKGNQDRRQERFDRKQGLPRRSPEGAKAGSFNTREKRDWTDRPPREKPHGDRLKRDPPPAGRAPFTARPPFKARPPFNRDAPPRDRDSGPDDPKPWRAGGGRPRGGSGGGPPRPPARRDDRPRGPKPPRSGGGGGGRR